VVRSFEAHKNIISQGKVQTYVAKNVVTFVAKTPASDKNLPRQRRREIGQ